MQKSFFYLSVILIFTNCAVSRNVRYDNVNADLPRSSTTIATWDQGEQVRTGSRKPNFVGYTRYRVGFAYPMGTKSGNPLAQEMTASIASSLKESGNKITIALAKVDDSKAMIINKLTQV